MQRSSRSCLGLHQRAITAKNNTRGCIERFGGLQTKQCMQVRFSTNRLNLLKSVFLMSLYVCITERKLVKNISNLKSGTLPLASTCQLLTPVIVPNHYHPDTRGVFLRTFDSQEVIRVHHTTIHSNHNLTASMTYLSENKRQFQETKI